VAIPPKFDDTISLVPAQPTKKLIYFLIN